MTMQISRHRGSSHTSIEVEPSRIPAAGDHFTKELSSIGKCIVITTTASGAAVGAVAAGYIAMLGSNYCKEAVRNYILDNMYIGDDYPSREGINLEEGSKATGLLCTIKCASVGAALGAAAGCFLACRVAKRFF